MSKILSKEEVSKLKKAGEIKKRLFRYSLTGDIYASTMDEAADVIMKISKDNKECLLVKTVSLLGV